MSLTAVNTSFDKRGIAMITMTAGELAEYCGVSKTTARNRLMRYELGQMTEDQVLTKGKMKTRSRESHGRKPQRKTDGQGTAEWRRLKNEPRGADKSEKAFDKSLSDEKIQQLWRDDKKWAKSHGVSFEESAKRRQHEQEGFD